MTVALSVAVGQGAEAVVCASTGNTSASMAAYAARAGVKPLVLVPQGKIAAGKLAQAIVHGAQVIMVRGNFDDCLRISRGLAERLPGGAGELGQPDAPRGPEDRVVRDRRLPRRRPRRARAAGRQRRQHLGVLEGLPRVPARPAAATRAPQMLGWQAAGAAPLVSGVAGGRARDGRLRDPDRQPGVLAPRGGRRRRVRRPLPRPSTDEQILSAQRELAGARRRLRRAGVRRRAWPGCSPRLESPEHVGRRPAAIVVTVTGHGLKDIDTALSTFTDLVDTVVERRRGRRRGGGRPALRLAR